MSTSSPTAGGNDEPTPPDASEPAPDPEPAAASGAGPASEPVAARDPARTPEPAAASSVRASDDERELVVQQLSEHMTHGRLTLAELDERAGRAFAATTRRELQELLDDLPDVHTAAPAERRKATRWIVSVMGGTAKRGRWRVGTRVNSIVLMGGNDVDLRRAELDSDDVTIVVISVMGGTDVYVPDGIDVDVGGFSLMGGTDERGSERDPRPGAPRIRLLAYNLMGGTDVWRVPVEAWNLPLKQARSVAKRAR